MHFQISPLADIRSAIPVLADWHHQEWRHLNSPDYDLNARVKDYQQIAKAKSFPAMFVAHQDNIPLGSARLIEDDMDTHPELYPWLASLYVHKDYRQQGVGSALIHKIENTAVELGFKTVYLFTENKQAIYHKRAWKIHSNETYCNQAITIMYKHLGK